VAQFPSGLAALSSDRRIPLSGDVAMSDAQSKRGEWSWWYLLFVIQFVAVLWPPFYNKADPYWIGIPFFYWYQLLWVIVGAVLTAIVYFATENRRGGHRLISAPSGGSQI
jgi:Protein of unknown function (DUF3311)